MKNVNTNYVLIAAVIIMAILVYFLGKQSYDKKDAIDRINKIGAQLETIKRSRNILKEENLVLSGKNTLYLDSIRSINIRYRESENRRIGATKYYEKRLRNIDNLSANQHNVFFAERYASDTEEVSND